MRWLAVLCLAVPMWGTGHAATVCWSNSGVPFPQPEAPCPPCWHSELPATTIPYESVDRCVHPAEPVEAPPVLTG